MSIENILNKSKLSSELENVENEELIHDIEDSELSIKINKDELNI